jgi:hypothetical protein
VPGVLSISDNSDTPVSASHRSEERVSAKAFAAKFLLHSIPELVDDKIQSGHYSLLELNDA